MGARTRLTRATLVVLPMLCLAATPVAAFATERPTPAPPSSAVTYSAADVSLHVTQTATGKRYVTVTLKPSECVKPGQKVAPPRRLSADSTGRFSYQGPVAGMSGQVTISGRIVSSARARVEARYRRAGCAWRLTPTTVRRTRDQSRDNCQGDQTLAWVKPDGTPLAAGVGARRPKDAKTLCWPPLTYRGTMEVTSISSHRSANPLSVFEMTKHAEGEFTFALKWAHPFVSDFALYVASSSKGDWEIQGKSESEENSCKYFGGDKLTSFESEFGGPSIGFDLEPDFEYSFNVRPGEVPVTEECTTKGDAPTTTLSRTPWPLGDMGPFEQETSGTYGLRLEGAGSTGPEEGWTSSFRWSLSAVK